MNPTAAKATYTQWQPKDDYQQVKWVVAKAFQKFPKGETVRVVDGVAYPFGMITRLLGKKGIEDTIVGVTATSAEGAENIRVNYNPEKTLLNMLKVQMDSAAKTMVKELRKSLYLPSPILTKLMKNGKTK